MRTLLLAVLCCALAAQSVEAQQNRSDAFDVSELTSELQLAVRVEISSTGVKRLSADVIYGAPQTRPAFEDLVVAVDNEEGEDQYFTIADPRIVFDAPRNKRRGVTVIFMKFSPTLKTLSITPTDEAPEERLRFMLEGPPFGREGRARTRTLDLRPAVREACRNQPQIAGCSGR
jgi:hypothetical protein